jgi:hypothetical protein
MRKETTVYILLALTAIMITSMFVSIPASAFIYSDTNAPWTNNTSDSLYEFYGPHVDQLLFHEYHDTDSMWTGMGLGEIDVCDWPLTTLWKGTFSSGDYLSNITMISAGGEAGYYQIDFNHNYHSTLGQIQPYVSNATNKWGIDDPNGRPNPVYINGTGYTYNSAGWLTENETGYLKPYVGEPGQTPPGQFPPISSSYHFRMAVDSKFNRTEYERLVGLAYVQIKTPIPSYMGKYSEGGYIWDACPGYPYNLTLAEANLTAANIKCDAANSWVRYWDLNNDGVAQPIEIDACKLRFTYRSDLARSTAGIMLTNELLAENFTFIAADSGLKTPGANTQQCMYDKRYDMTTFGWIYIGPDPDYLCDLYHVMNYWDVAPYDTNCDNTADVNDSVLNQLGQNIKYALTSEDARYNTYLWQIRFWQMNHALPLCSTNRVMSQAKWYTGGTNGMLTGDVEDKYRRIGTTNNDPKRAWLDFCNEQGIGSNSWMTMENAFPEGYLYGAPSGNMTLRYGWSTDTMPQQINPLVSAWVWDSYLIGEIYDTMGYRDPYAKGTWKGDLAKSWQAGSWYDSFSHTTKSKVTVTIRSDAMWQDGYPVTIDDVIYSLVYAGRDCVMHGYSPPWWWPTGSLVKSLTLIDAYTVEILYDVASYLVEGWTLGFYIIPKHVWKPIIDSGTPNPTGFSPDPNMIGSGPYRYAAETYGTSILLVANKPGSKVKTDLEDSVSVTSPGYHAYCPVHVDVHTVLKLVSPWDGLTPAYTGSADPTGTCWHMEKPYYCYNYTIVAYTPNPYNGEFNQSAHVTIAPQPPSTEPPNVPPIAGDYHVYLVLYNAATQQYELYLDWYSAKLFMPYAPGTTPAQLNAKTWIVPAEFAITVENLETFSNLNLTKYVYVDGKLNYSESFNLEPIYGKQIKSETFNSDTMDTAVALAHSPILQGSVIVKNSTMSFKQDTSTTYYDYAIDYTNGKITCHAAGNMLPSTDYMIEYSYPTKAENKELLNINVPKCNHNVTVAVHIDGPAHLDDSWSSYVNPWISQWINFTLYTWTTINVDFGGNTYYDLIGWGNFTYKMIMPIFRVPDCKVRVDDVLACATAFGANPGDIRWDSTADVNRDYKCRVDDVLAVALEFGAG